MPILAPRMPRKTSRKVKKVSGVPKLVPAFKVEQRNNWYVQDDWLIRETRKDHVNCCEFLTEEEARSAAERWNKGDGMAVFETWIAPPDDADDSHRGWYLVHVKGLGLVSAFGGSWHQDAESARTVAKLRDEVSKHGLDAVRGTLGSLGGNWRIEHYGKHDAAQANRLRKLST